VRGVGASTLGAAGRFGAQYGVLGGAVGAAMFTNGVLNASMSGDRVRNTLRFATGSEETGARELAFARDLTKRLGLEFETTAASYAKFVSVGRLSKLTYSEIRDTFEGVSNAVAVMGLSAEESQGAMLALTQMLSKGRVTGEELNQQLAERIPGAVTLMAKALSVSTAELGKMMERGELVATDVLPKFGRELKAQFGPDAARNAKTTTGAINELKNAWTSFKQELIDAGFVDALKKVMGFLVTVVREFGNIIAAVKKAFDELKGSFGGGALGKIVAMAGAVPLGVSDWAN
jgi:tape measure domain-containing protein